jgi:ABC-type multidrug transport system fused ATPase/permease subunit
MLGVLEPTDGVVRISGVSPATAILNWPGAIAYVAQDTPVVDGDVRSNVALGLPDDLVDDELVWQALRRAHLADFLEENRQGLNTIVGEHGIQLSGGQRQRLGIARALYTRPRLLVLDEATSALDAATEDAIGRTLAELSGEVTLVIIAHRLATIRDVDRVAYMRDGELVALGTFDEVRAEAADFDSQAQLLGL